MGSALGRTEPQLVKPPLWMRLIPKRLMSRTLGTLGLMPLPGFLLAPVLRLYGRSFGVNAEEMARPYRAYRNFRDFFTRELVPGARTPDPDPRVVCSPADGAVQRTGPIEAGRIIQVKGIDYTVAELLGDAVLAERFDGGSFHTVYLAPGDYHRFHWPVDGRLTLLRHLPGAIWPVNQTAVNTVQRLFAINERVAALGTCDGGGDFAFVPVGALNVGSIRMHARPFRTNRFLKRKPSDHPVEEAISRGGEAGWFAFGSSIVMLLSKEAGRFDELEPGTTLRVGQRIGERSGG